MPMAALPEFTDDDAECGADHPAGERADDDGNLQVDQAMRCGLALNAANEYQPRRRAPPHRAGQSAGDGESAQQRRPTRLVVAVGDRAESPLLFDVFLRPSP